MPSTRIRPVSGFTRPRMARMRVDFPAPFAPSSPTAWSVRAAVTPSSATTPPYRLVTPSISTSGDRSPGTVAGAPTGDWLMRDTIPRQPGRPPRAGGAPLLRLERVDVDVVDRPVAPCHAQAHGHLRRAVGDERRRAQVGKQRERQGGLPATDGEHRQRDGTVGSQLVGVDQLDAKRGQGVALV